MAVSQNGWSANDVSLTQNYTIGNGRQIRLRRGDAGFLLKHVADWFDAKIEDIDAGQIDDWGYAERPIRDGVELSNHASGTAMDLNATKHPLGVRGTFPSAKASAIRQHLALYDGALRWGGDYANRADEMHFEINADAAKVAAVARSIRAAAAKPEAPAPPAPPVPTLADIIVALERLAAVSDNPKAARDYLEAADDLRPIQAGNRVKVPTTITGVRNALVAILARNDLPPGHRRRINAAYDLIRGI